ncbi:TIR domain-containing protein [Halomonas sp. 25-S5]|uniref:TIR domain-containing protein n=1 Tax=Halomonas sp. 25-S5 TaxID=2994065 RepID=UPI0024685416|nr:TIR domain-containing protein [Halomonas sp. 25-S5]
MITGYSPPLAVSFIWHPSDSEEVNPILNVIRISFSRDKDKPFSRGLNIPLFFFSSESSGETPSNYPDESANTNILFVFTSVNTAGRKKWRRYIENLPQSPSIKIIPIAVDADGYGHGGALTGLNCIRKNDWAVENRDLNAVVALAHEIYRFSCKSLTFENKGVNSSIRIFLSHSKSGDTGKLHSEEIKRFIDNTNMGRFFDANEISPGYHFDQEIENHIKDATLLAIESDAYSSRYWCQREILIAKQHNRPVVVVNCLEDFEDRIFPAASNVPCVHISSTVPMSERDILRILSTAIIETLRYSYSMQCLEAYKHAGWIDEDSELIARPPEIRQVLNFKMDGVEKMCYPEPPVYSIEADWHEELGVQAFTPLWSPLQRDSLSGKRIGISISDVPRESFADHHIHADHLVRLSQDLARHLLARSATLLYGGDLRPGGFTEFILDEARILKDRLGETAPPIENHLAWPLYVSDPEITAWRAKYQQVMETIEYEVAGDVFNNIDKEAFLPPNTPQNSYVWSRCLTEMRERSISSSTARICAGGRVAAYKGKMPGVLEEISLALDAQKSIFLLGAFGGVVGDVCNLLLTSDVPETLTEEWQISHNEGYSDLQNLARSFGHESDYDTIIASIRSHSVSELASRCGLNDKEYKKLMKSPYVDECVYLILKGLNEN